MLFGKHIRKYYGKYWYLFLLGIIALLVVDVVQTLIPDYLGQIVDGIKDISTDWNSSIFGDALIGTWNDSLSIFKFSQNELTQNNLFYLLFKVLICALIMATCRIVFRLTIFRASNGVEAGLRKDMFEKAEKLSNSYYTQNKVGTVMAWFTDDVETISDCLGWGTVMLVDAFFLGAVVIIKMFLVDAWVAVLALIPIILIIVWGALVETFMNKMWQERQKSYDRVYDFAQENFTGIRVIKAFVKETKEIHAFAKVARRNRDETYKFAKISILFDVFIQLIITIEMSLVLGLGAWFVYEATTSDPIVIFNHSIDISIGQLTQFLGYINILIWPMIALGQIVTMIARARGSLKRISNFLDAEEDIKNPENAVVLENVKGEIEFKHLTFKYPEASIDYLKDISLKINPGENVGIIGKIGCGKTTLANSLLRLYNVNEGSIFIDGVDIMHADLASLRDAISYAPQDNFLFSDEIGNNIAFSSDNKDMDLVKEAADFSNVKEDIEGFTNGFETISGERGVTLSGGQKQRISLARAYYKQAPIMIMDDTVSAVDVKTEEIILKNIKEKRNGLTTIIIASRVSTVMHMDKIIVLDNGRLSGFGSHEELMKTNELYQRMVYLQELEKEVEGGTK